MSSIPFMAVHASSGVLCCASSSSVTGLGLPPLQPRSFLERQRRIQSNRLHPGPSFPRLADLAFPSVFLLLAPAPAAAAAATLVFFGAARELVLLMGQTAGIANALASGRVRLVGFLLCTVGLEGGVELVANGEGGSGLQWLRSKDMMAFRFSFGILKLYTVAAPIVLVQSKEVNLRW